ncbi:hypothetical protein NQ314_011677 [Rhamnusium bicolor]|uniref:Uncharacterized protein n=1 Tax=Rhamnusium bicolor TaxID=1586634 RepID=A0AAV8XGU1_9CUCU|nr:hypothetical protein NQ314_011677 [Rhamnusium bicolor]
MLGDNRVFPVRGQIIRVEAPWQFHSYLIDSDKSCYIIPNINCVILGGTKQLNFNLEVDDIDKQNILR